MLSDQRRIVGALLDAYRQGAFPMADPDTGDLNFYTADPRGILPLDPPNAFHVPRSLHRRLRSGWFDIRADTAFEGVVRGCALPRPREPVSWIDDRIVDLYTLLHRAGHAHSVEAWRTDAATGDEHLVGGIYGVSIGAAFFGESMFSLPRPRATSPAANGHAAAARRHPLDGTDASKVCLAHLVHHLRARGYTLFDTQLVNPHIARFGCVEIPAADYLRRLAEAVERPVAWGALESRRAPG